jgi:hypothetical protein
VSLPAASVPASVVVARAPADDDAHPCATSATAAALAHDVPRRTARF